ncbi:MAG: transcriptional repressor [Solirubrobacterales bacterium]|nr:transcriptional repressor [Solirubrobacterales bacterium]
MPEAPQTAPLHLATIEDAVVAMRERGLRLSTARRLVLEALFAADGAVSAQQLSRELNLDPTSVYRNLELLERFGAVRHVHLAHGAGLYVLAGRQEREYLYCERCETVTAVAVSDLDAARKLIEEQFGFQARFTHFAIVGICQLCAAREQDTNTPAGKHRPATTAST